jgi:hypothetical protein
VDVFWLAAVVTILVEGGTLVRVVWRFMQKNRDNPLMLIAMGAIGILWSVVLVVLPPNRDTLYWFIPLAVLLTAGMAGGMIATGFWAMIVKSQDKTIDKYNEMLKEARERPRWPFPSIDDESDDGAAGTPVSPRHR